MVKNEWIFRVAPLPRWFEIFESPPVCSMDTSVSVHLPCFAWYTVEVITSLDIGILIYVTIDRPVPPSLPPLPPSFPDSHDLPARISHTELPSGSSPKVGVQTISSLRMCIYTRYISILKINRAETIVPAPPPSPEARGINCICRHDFSLPCLIAVKN